jgi:hypothetical protein
LLKNKIKSLPGAKDKTPGKEIIEKKNKKSLPGAYPASARQSKSGKKIKKSLPGVSDIAPGKERTDRAGAMTVTFLCRGLCLLSAKSLPGVR